MSIRKHLAMVLVGASFGAAAPLQGSYAQGVEGLAASGSPASQLPNVDPTKGFATEDLGANTFTVTDGSYMAMFAVYDSPDGGGVIVVDAPPTLGDRLLSAVAERTDKRVTHLVYSHFHTDHIGHAGALPDDIVRVGHVHTASALKAIKDPRRPVPTLTFERDLALEVGDRVLHLAERGPAHTPGNIYIHDPASRTVMLVDVVYPGWVPFKNLGVTEGVRHYLNAFDVLLSYDFDHFVGGHVGQSGTRADVETAREFAYDLKAQAGAAYAGLSFADHAADTGTRNPWQLYGGYQDALTKACAERVVANWKDRLSGTEVYAADNCWTMIEAIGIELGPVAKP